MKQGIIFDIKRFAVNDGPGIRTTVFLKGCPMKCQWCHNPESQKHIPEKVGEKDVIGEAKSVDDVVKEIEKEVLFYDESKGGVTFSGGEPLDQPEFLCALLDECRKREIHTVVDTTGDAPSKVFDAVIDKADLFLYDLKIMDEKKHIQYTGASNRLVIKNLKTLSKKRKPVIIRFPVIPGVTDSEENIKAVGVFVSSLKNIKEIDLLPYHRTAEAKYSRLKKEYKLKGVTPPSTERMDEVKNLFHKYARGIEIKRDE